MLPLCGAFQVAVDRTFGEGTITPLQKMGSGMLIAALAFIMSFAVQSKIEMDLTNLPYHKNEFSLRVINGIGESEV